MTRHKTAPKKPDRAAIYEDRVRLEAEMETFEEEIFERNARFSWWNLTSLMEFFKFPEPKKMREIEQIDDDTFSPRRHAFFTPRTYGEQQPDTDDESTAHSSARSSQSGDSDDDRRSTNSDGTPGPPKDWKMYECFVFCMRQLIWSRIWIFLLQFIAAELAGDRFRTDAFNLADRMMPFGRSLFGDVANRAFAGLRRWDAQHFLFIADNHYVFEHSLAFFSGLPEITNVTRMFIMYWFSNHLGIKAPSWLLTAVIMIVINLFFFICTGLVLFMVVLMITRSAKRGLLAVSLFAYNPASIFFTACYTESMFAALTMTGFCIGLFGVRSTRVSTRISSTLVTAVMFGLTFMVRSNGSLNLFFVAWFFLGSLLWQNEQTVPKCTLLQESIDGSRNDKHKREASAKLKAFDKKRLQKRKIFAWTDDSSTGNCAVIALPILAIVCFLVFCIPYVFMTNSTAAEFCEAPEGAKEIVSKLHKALRIPPEMVTIVDAHEKAKWCKKDRIFNVFPNYYPEIQAKYWQVGLFQYWQLKKIPCFLLMLPAAIITLLAVRWALRDVFARRRWYNIWLLFGRSDHCLPHVFHVLFLLVTAVFFINAEVFTRIIFSASPLLYIYLATFLDEQTQGNTFGNRLWHYEQSPGILPFFIFRRVWNRSWQARLLYMYFIGYFVFGTMAHAAWLPFT